MKFVRTHIVVACMMCIAAGLALTASAALMFTHDSHGAASERAHPLLERLQALEHHIAEFDSATP